LENKHDIMYTYLFPLVIGVLVLAASYFLGLVGIVSAASAFALFVIIGLSVFLSEVVICRKTRVLEREQLYRFISRLIFETPPRPTIGAKIKMLDIGEVSALEALSTEVWIYAYDLKWEDDGSEFQKVVRANLEKGVKYRYMIPNVIEVKTRASAMKMRLSDIGGIDKLLEFRITNKESGGLNLALTLYNPHIYKSSKEVCDECIGVFFPHFSHMREVPSTVPKFYSVAGSLTADIQENFIAMWEGSTAF